MLSAHSRVSPDTTYYDVLTDLPLFGFGSCTAGAKHCKVIAVESLAKTLSKYWMIRSILSRGGPVRFSGDEERRKR